MAALAREEGRKELADARQQWERELARVKADAGPPLPP